MLGSAVVGLVLSPTGSLGSWVPAWSLSSCGVIGSLEPQELPGGQWKPARICWKPVFAGTHQDPSAIGGSRGCMS